MQDLHWQIPPQPHQSPNAGKTPTQQIRLRCGQSGRHQHDLAHIDDIYDQAIHIFLTMARCQFFYDVNKRMGRLMMNGHLFQHGYPAINLPAKRQLEFNTLMLAFYASGDEMAMNAFMRSCMDERVLRIMREA